MYFVHIQYTLYCKVNFAIFLLAAYLFIKKKKKKLIQNARQKAHSSQYPFQIYKRYIICELRIRMRESHNNLSTTFHVIINKCNSNTVVLLI